MPRQNSTTWVVGDPILAARLNKTNQDLDDLYLAGSDRLKIYRISTDPAFQVTIGAGTYRVGKAEGQYAGGTLTVSVSVTTYIMIDSAGAIQTSTVTWNGLYTRLGIVVSNGSGITSINIWRSDAVGWELSLAGFQNITSTTYSNGMLTAFTADWINHTVTYVYRRRLKSITNGTNTWTINYSKGRLSTTVKT